MWNRVKNIWKSPEKKHRQWTIGRVPKANIRRDLVLAAVADFVMTCIKDENIAIEQYHLDPLLFRDIFTQMGYIAMKKGKILVKDENGVRIDNIR